MVLDRHSRRYDSSWDNESSEWWISIGYATDIAGSTRRTQDSNGALNQR